MPATEITAIRAREILDKAEAEKRDLTAEESQEFDRLMAEADALTLEALSQG